MDCWSAENATNAFLTTLKMGERGKAPDVTEFISAMAGGNNSQLMVMACTGHPGSALLGLGLVAAAHQTGGRVVCILRSEEEMHAIKETLILGDYAKIVEFVIGDDVKTLLASNYEGADFVLIDCKLEDFQQVFEAAQQGVNVKSAFIVGYNALQEGPKLSFDHKGYFLPIGEGLLVSKIRVSQGKNIGGGRRSHWVVEVDECTGEEHLYRVSTSPNTN
ncbi:hypothetical protein KY290_002174 [Solanum tuberosum]|uniref:NAD(P)-binding protein n=2 Tax=Solanum tuberosum TaxID=4113 RepID=A0ABQ7WPB4_SOLTU|nr:PREDICTED: uncharacterized protein LOC102598945 [Solanum tuberosum]KAH0726350.1 hypothetical protein KY284_002215 [Solanum tuberosum]KAH0731142.1 hypothetical protein KY289_002330 [Solanum tuberosum]KAH0766191.1 hypothetical protein KY285_002062 [Solanum tuberosum]KAH0782576.1 hypothetical protein KY290_002174 [Solanum tuberosum]